MSKFSIIVPEGGGYYGAAGAFDVLGDDGNIFTTGIVTKYFWEQVSYFDSYLGTWLPDPGVGNVGHLFFQENNVANPQVSEQTQVGVENELQYRVQVTVYGPGGSATSNIIEIVFGPYSGGEYYGG